MLSLVVIKRLYSASTLFLRDPEIADPKINSGPGSG
jgi:hypothetical protein